MNLNAINRLAQAEGRAPWSLSFSFGRSLQVRRRRPAGPSRGKPPAGSRSFLSCACGLMFAEARAAYPWLLGCEPRRPACCSCGQRTARATPSAAATWLRRSPPPTAGRCWGGTRGPTPPSPPARARCGKASAAGAPTYEPACCSGKHIHGHIVTSCYIFAALAGGGLVPSRRWQPCPRPSAGDTGSRCNHNGGLI